MPENSQVKVVEKCRVAPPPDAMAELTLPLTFYDLQWLSLPPIQDLHFYRFRHPNPYPTSNSIISSIKSSLSLVLKHFLPLAGNLICSIDSDRMPELCYLEGNSVSLTIAESSLDFDHLVGDHQKDLHIFSNLLPQLPEPTLTSGLQVSPLLALQVTVFPNSGICIGKNLRHVVGDANAFINFSESWASINKFNGDSLDRVAYNATPSYDRSVVQDPFHLDLKILNDIKLLKSQTRSRINVPDPNPVVSKDEVLATFILHSSDIMNLKRLVSTTQPITRSNNNISSFTVTCALIWSCLSKSLAAVVKDNNYYVEDEDKQEYLLAYINCRQRFDQSIPKNYFGNCIVPCLVGSTHGQLAGNRGLLAAASAIDDAIRKRLHDSQGFLRGDWIQDSYIHTRAVAPGMLEIDGATQHNVYNNNADFDWGELEKFESVAFNSSEIVLLITLSRRFQGARELSITLPKKRMDAFTTIFTNCINSLQQQQN